MDTPPSSAPLAVVGAGFSGTMVAIHLLRTLPRERPILLFERSGRFAHGLAYGTAHRGHLLNVRASNMSALPDVPDHFVRWLERQGEAAASCDMPAGSFAPRGVYGRYLEELLKSRSVGDEPGARLRLQRDDVTDLVPVKQGYAVHLASGERVLAGGVVLACGNLRAGGFRSRYAVDPWQASSLDDLMQETPLLIVGTGLTMIDAVATVRDRGFAGPIIALSRRGLLPQAHGPAPAWTRPEQRPEGGRSLLRLLVRIRAEVAEAARAGFDWRSVIDSLRPEGVALWQGFSPADQARFLRHLRAYWDVHRHRAAPPAIAMIDRERASGGLRILRAKIEAISDLADGALVTVRERGTRFTRDVKVQRIVDASGFGRVGDTDDLLLRRLLARGLVAPDKLGLGLSVGRDFATIDRRGREAQALWTLGPLLRGTLWECTAVPDIRVQAAHLADTIAERMDALEAGATDHPGDLATA